MPMAGGIIYADDVNKLGRVDETVEVSDEAPSSGTTELVVDSLTVGVVAGRTYRVTWVINWTGSVANDRFLMRTRAAGAQLTYDTADVKSTPAIVQDVIVSEYVAGSTTNVTFTGTVQRVVGTGTLTARGAASQARILSVDYVSG